MRSIQLVQKDNFNYSIYQLDQCLNTNVSQGNVVMHLRCGGIFSDHLIANLLLSPVRKEL